MNSGIPMFQEKFHPLKSMVVGTDGIPFEEILLYGYHAIV